MTWYRFTDNELLKGIAHKASEGANDFSTPILEREALEALAQAALRVVTTRYQLKMPKVEDAGPSIQPGLETPHVIGGDEVLAKGNLIPDGGG